MAIKTFTLGSGMQVVLEENHSAKVVSYNALVKVGSAFEAPDEAGICHVIEHMLFKGTPTRPTGTIARDVEAAGGDINAYTSFDQTVFYINMATRYADRGLEILADAIKNPLFDAEELAKEAEVILEEIRREHDNPAHMAGEHLFQTAYKVHTYGRPIIGYPETVKSFTRDMLMGFYKKWYTPHNIVFIAVGDFKTDEMLRQIEVNFADFHGDVPQVSPIPDEPAQTAPRFFVKSMNVQSTYVALGFHIPCITDPDVPSMDLLSHILGGTDSSRLEQEIKEKKKLAHNIYCAAYTPRFPGLFYIGAMCSEKNISKTMAAIDVEVERIKSEPVTAEELSRAKINLRSAEIYEKETVGGEGGKLASFIATAGSHEFEKRYYQQMLDVQADGIMRAARKYLTPENMTIVLIVPERSRMAKDKAAAKKLIVAPKARAGKRASAEPLVVKLRLSNGTKLVIKENHKLPLVAVSSAALGGARFETKRTCGISGLMTRSLVKGTTSRSAVQVAKDIEKLAGHIDGFSGRNACGVKCEFLSENLHDGLALFADVLCHPSFLAKEVAHEKDLALKAIKDQEDNLSNLAFSKFLETLYPKHPYGQRLLGTKESVSRITRNDLVKYHRNVMRSGELIISVVGDVNPKEVREALEELTKDLPRGRSSVSRLPMDKKPAKPNEVRTIKPGKKQSHIVIGFQGTTYTSRDRFPMTVLNNILSGQGGRLFIGLRDRLSLAYSVSSMNQEGIEPGYFTVYIGTDPSKEKTAVKEILNELRKICTKRVTKDELDRSKQYLVGTYELDLQRLAALANSYTFYELYGLGLDEIENYPKEILKVTADDVLATARKYIDVDAYTMAVVAPK